MAARGVRLLRDGPLAPALDDGGAIALNDAADFLVRLGVKDFRVNCHETLVRERTL
jgi:hypothetical protein